jgi:hypothetical protein
MSKAQRSDMKEIRGSLLRSEGGGVDEMSLGRGDVQKYCTRNTQRESCEAS